MAKLDFQWPWDKFLRNEEQNLFQIEIFCKFINVFPVSLPSLLSLSIHCIIVE